MNSGSFTGQVQLVSSGGACSGGDTIHFTIPTGTRTLQSSSTPPTTDGAYITCVQASQSTATNSPQYAQVVITVYSATQQSSPQVVALTATPAAFLASSGTFNAQLSPTCLGACPGTPSYALASNPSGTCSGNNNNSFSLTSAGNLTNATTLNFGTVYACVRVNMTNATNSGQIFLLQITSVASPAINLISLRQPYFASGTTFSSLIDIACQSPTVLGRTNDATLCTGVPTYTLDNTPGDCAIANNTGPGGTSPTFAISGNTLSLTAPQTVVGDYNACVTTAMAGATSTHTQLKATISTGNTGSPQISGIYFNPPLYAPNSPYSGTLVAYCLNNTLQGTAGLMATHCPSAPTFSFGTTAQPPAGCNGGNNNGSFLALSGPNNSVITSNGNLTTGNLFPCIIATMPGAIGSGSAMYVNLYAGTAPTPVGISVYPTFFSTSKGSMTGALRPMCGANSCTGTPTYTLDNTVGHCTGSNNAPFTLSGSALTITTSTPGTYTACLDMAMTGATNSGAAFPVTVTATASTSNCPATPPPQAAAAGFTTLAYCLDASAPLYANIFNWVNCAPGVVANTSSEFWSVGGTTYDNDCGVGTGFPIATQVVDSTTGKTVLKFHWDGTANPDFIWGTYTTLAEGTGNLSGPDFPQALYAETRVRLSPDHVNNFGGQCCSFDFWTFTTSTQAIVPPGCIQGGDPTNYCYNQIPEVDIIESGNGSGFLDAVHQYSISSDSADHPLCCTSGQGFLSSGDGPSQEMWNANGFPNIPFANYTSWGARFLTDGVSSTQYCFYWDNVQVQSFTGSGTPRFAPSCQVYNWSTLPGPLGYQLRGRHQFNMWWPGGWSFNSAVCQLDQGGSGALCRSNGQQGPENQDAYLEYLAIWTCANPDKYKQSDNMDSQPPCPVSQPWPY